MHVNDSARGRIKFGAGAAERQFVKVLERHGKVRLCEQVGDAIAMIDTMAAAQPVCRAVLSRANGRQFSGARQMIADAVSRRAAGVDVTSALDVPRQVRVVACVAVRRTWVECSVWSCAHASVDVVKRMKRALQCAERAQ